MRGGLHDGDGDFYGYSPFYPHLRHTCGRDDADFFGKYRNVSGLHDGRLAAGEFFGGGDGVDGCFLYL